MDQNEITETVRQRYEYHMREAKRMKIALRMLMMTEEELMGIEEDDEVSRLLKKDNVREVIELPPEPPAPSTPIQIGSFPSGSNEEGGEAIHIIEECNVEKELDPIIIQELEEDREPKVVIDEVQGVKATIHKTHTNIEPLEEVAETSEKKLDEVLESRDDKYKADHDDISRQIAYRFSGNSSRENYEKAKTDTVIEKRDIPAVDPEDLNKGEKRQYIRKNPAVVFNPNRKKYSRSWKITDKVHAVLLNRDNLWSGVSEIMASIELSEDLKRETEEYEKMKKTVSSTLSQGVKRGHYEKQERGVRGQYKMYRICPARLNHLNEKKRIEHV